MVFWRPPTCEITETLGASKGFMYCLFSTDTRKKAIVFHENKQVGREREGERGGQTPTYSGALMHQTQKLY